MGLLLGVSDAYSQGIDWVLFPSEDLTKEESISELILVAGRTPGGSQTAVPTCCWLGLILGFERLLTFLGLWSTPSSKPAMVHQPLCLKSVCFPLLPLKDSYDSSGRSR